MERTKDVLQDWLINNRLTIEDNYFISSALFYTHIYKLYKILNKLLTASNLYLSRKKVKKKRQTS